MISDIILKVSNNNGIDKKVVEKAYKAYWRAVKKHISSLPLKEDLTEEEFSKLRPNVNIPSIGKLYVTYERYLNTKKQDKIIKELTNKKYATHKED